MGKHSKPSPSDKPQPVPHRYYPEDDFSYGAPPPPHSYTPRDGIPQYQPPPQRIDTSLLAAAPLKETRPQPAVRGRKQRSKFKRVLRRVLIAVLVVIVVFVTLGIVGNIVGPKNKAPHSAPGPARSVAVADVLRNNSPNWHVTAHIVAVVRPEDGGKSVMLVNSGTGRASGMITFPQLGISATHVTVWNVWDNTVSPPTIRALRVVLAPGTAEFLILQ